MTTLEDLSIDNDILSLPTADIVTRTHLLSNEINIMKHDSSRLTHEKSQLLDKIKDNTDKINNNKQLPYLVGNVVELLNINDSDLDLKVEFGENETGGEDDGGDGESSGGDGETSSGVTSGNGQGSGVTGQGSGVNDSEILNSGEVNNKRSESELNNESNSNDSSSNSNDSNSNAPIKVEKPKFYNSAVIKTSTRQTIFLPLIGLVDPTTLKPNDLIGVNKDSYLILDTLPSEFDSRVKAMEVDEKPTEDYSDIGGLDKQIEELIEAVVLPMKQADKFKKLGIKPPKGALMYGPPGTGKTLLARACAAQSGATFLKLAAPQLVQMFIGDGAKLVRDAFALAKEKAPTIIFIDELDAIGTKRFDSDKSGDREVQRTMLELLNQLDGFDSDDRVKVLAATNRVDTLDPALLRSGRLDRKIEFPLPSEESRESVLKIHARKLNCDNSSVNWRELARSTDEFNGAQLKAVTVEAGMIALRNGKSSIKHEDFVDAISEVQARKSKSKNFYA